MSIALIAICDVLSGSGNQSNNKGAQVDTSLTETIARERITTYLLETLAAMPPGVGLSWIPDNPDLGTAGPASAGTVPCNDRDTETGGPEEVQISYWVTGVPPGQDARYFDLMRNFWTSRGWDANPDPGEHGAAVLTPMDTP
ncbi:MAG: hypothetical protein J2P18_06535 [Nocardia sp.]|nr:hypothetical protein [Nocardia sp.]